MSKFLQFMIFKILFNLLRYPLIVVMFIIISAISNDCLADPNLESLSQASDNNAAKLKFELLHEASKKNYEVWSGNVWGTIGFLVVVLGWLLTSEGSRKFISKKTGARKVAISVIAIIAIINMFLNLYLARKSTEIQQDLSKNKYTLVQGLEPKHYGYYHVPYRNAIMSDILVGSMFILVMIFILRSSKWEESSKEKIILSKVT